MMPFRILLLAMFALLALYTSVTIGAHGWNLLSVFFGDIARMGWPGQFNLDFSMMLTLSALWVLWRNEFSGVGIALAPVALFGGAMFLTLYLFALSLQTKGDVRAMLIGPRRAGL
jgi:hypothetical protein